MPTPSTYEEVLAQLPLSRFAPVHRPFATSASNPPRATVLAILRALALAPGQRVLQIGLGSGYVSAAISSYGAKLYGVERLVGVTSMVRERLEAFGLREVWLREGNGAAGWPDQAPFDRILVLARGVDIQRALLEQLKPGGTLVALHGMALQQRELIRVTRGADQQLHQQSLGTLRVQTDFADSMVELGLIDDAQASRARTICAQTQRPLQDVLHEIAHLDERDIYRAMAGHAQMQHRPVQQLIAQLDLHVAEVIPRAFLDHHHLLPIGFEPDGKLLVVTSDPHATLDELAHAFPGKVMQPVLVSPTDWRRLWSAIDLHQHHPNVELSPPPPDDDDLLEEPVEDADVDSFAAGLFDALLLDAVGERASDIHLECYGENVRVRLRIDGELHDQPRFVLTPAELAALVNVIKVRARLDISERRLPQGGRIRLRAGESRFDLRVQTQPSLHAEHVVIRLLPQDAQAQDIEELGFSVDVANAYRRLLDSPNGLVLVVGPTGSGKSTTLYAGLRKLAADARRKVITVEDPIEYSIPNIQQTAVRPRIGFAFTDAMRSFVRQDPDVILVGEIRDGETALEAIRASQTGHLVLSTLHCNDAVDAIQRLYDLGMHPNSIASELLAVFSQRLAKRVCTDCRVRAAANPELLAELFPHGAPANFQCFEGRGCARCGGHGTRGRVAIVEFLHVTANIRRAIARQPALDDLRDIAKQGGLVPLRDTLLVQVQAGIVPLSEAPRLLQADAMAGH
jgi:type IV pilus assembly protein PilB